MKNEHQILTKKDLIIIVTFVVALAGGWFTLQAEVNYLSVRQEELRAGLENIHTETKVAEAEVRDQLIEIKIQLARIETDLAYIRAQLDERVERGSHAIRTERYPIQIEGERDPPQVHSAVQPYLQ